ncbi:MAG: GxxExxY protein [Bacteroidales bacterium]|nr:GxxExxY protein [Bacteroidales bacterium]MDD2387310.1 GxxExxY protein [Bacteroidales bacterium]MDD4217971.1 GxxExxY protein [Bacteroidales bacterium]MDY0143244.1 GxxExxY protein [Bacteroidales bacterium]
MDFNNVVLPLCLGPVSVITGNFNLNSSIIFVKSRCIILQRYVKFGQICNLNAYLSKIVYLKLSGCKLGLLINFNVTLVKNGIKRVINETFVNFFSCVSFSFVLLVLPLCTLWLSFFL